MHSQTEMASEAKTVGTGIMVGPRGGGGGGGGGIIAFDKIEKVASNTNDFGS